MAPSLPTVDMQSYSARLETFQIPHQLGKRRASSQGSKKRKDGAVEWPHKTPTPEQLARAGFFYRPAEESNDNVQCFLCSVKLDGWEESDNAVNEHLGHSGECAYAVSMSVSRFNNQAQELESRDPMSDIMVAARHATFTFGEGWPHESKKGWKCKISKMVEAGWTWDPNPNVDEDIDGVTCFYCDLSLDGWEPKDDPLQEHKRRSPDCRFFQLLEQWSSATSGTKTKKVKGRGKGSIRSSTASEASRMSVQSLASEAPSFADSHIDLDLVSEAEGTAADDSIITVATTASQTSGPPATKKRAGRPKATSKTSKAKAKAVGNNELDVEPLGPAIDDADELLGEENVAAPRPATKFAKKGKKSSAKTKQRETSVAELDMEEQPQSKKAASSPKLEVPGTPDRKSDERKRHSEVSAQLQDELDISMDQVEDESTPQIVLAQPKRGTKRMSNGSAKDAQPQSSVIRMELPIVVDQIESKPKRGRKPKQASNLSSELVTLPDPLGPETSDSQHSNAKTGKTSQSKSKKKQISTLHVSPELEEKHMFETEIEDADEVEIEQELERMAAEQAPDKAITFEQDRMEEFEPSPSHQRTSKGTQDFSILEDVTETENNPPISPIRRPLPEPTPSPGASDKENQSSSIVRSSAKAKPARALNSPTKTMRVPLAPGTPNRSPLKMRASPSKQISHLSSSAPWLPVDMETVLLASPQPTPNRLGQQLIDAAGRLTSPEKSMSVEEWVRYRAQQSEADLRRRCEEMVAVFEKEGMRALNCLEGINVVAQ